MEKRSCFGNVDTCLSIYPPANLTDVRNRTYEHFSIGHLHKHAKLRCGGVYETRGPCTTIAIELPVATACYRRRNFGEVAKQKVRTAPPLRFVTYAIQHVRPTNRCFTFPVRESLTSLAKRTTNSAKQTLGGSTLSTNSPFTNR